VVGAWFGEYVVEMLASVQGRRFEVPLLGGIGHRVRNIVLIRPCHPRAPCYNDLSRAEGEIVYRDVGLGQYWAGPCSGHQHACEQATCQHTSAFSHHGAPCNNLIEGKTFFSEEKTQKTFMSLSQIYPETRAQEAKVFWLFFQKELLA
jgi:hypothetical protein